MSEERELHAALAANAAFYTAFAAGDLRAMHTIWSVSEPVLCSHPGTLPLHGRTSVMESWQAILVQPPPIAVSEARGVAIRGVAFVTCLEHIGGEILAATNVFVWEEGQWRMAHHQSGAIPRQKPTGPEPEQPLH